MAHSSVTVNRKELFLRACRCQPVPRVPVWIMRQAGRYLPEYRAVRAKHTFLEVCKMPELAAQVSLQPFEILGVDAVIVFSDILIVAEAMGMPLEVPDGGPVLGNPVRDEAAVRALKQFDPEKETRFLGDAIRMICRENGADVPVLGFAGAPWTLACYMIEGRARTEFNHAKRMLYAEPQLLRQLLEAIARATARYLRSQIAAGARAVQIFDTWAGELGTREYEEFELPALQMLIREIDAGETPVILYSKASNHLLALLAKTGANVLSFDWRTDLSAARKVLGPRIALQGNVDPAILLSSEDLAGAAAAEAIEKTGGSGHILNLGHGILPETPVENARAFVRAGQAVNLQSQAATSRHSP
ncbi:MAG: uroporphyrinogen decarboxylase [Candidatus Acidiferrales bacterium]